MGVNYSLFSDDQHKTLSEYENLESHEIMLYGTFLFINHMPSDRKFFYKEFTVEKTSTNLTPSSFFSRISNPIPSLLHMKAGNLMDRDTHYEGFFLFDAFDFEASLATEIESKKNLFYSEEDLWKMLESTLSALDYMVSQGKSALCVTPYHIYIQENTYKLLDFEELTELSNNVDLTDTPLLFYQSPHLISVLKDQEPIEINEKDNVFSLGISILEAALLEHPLNIEEGDFSFEGLEESISKLNERYSSDFVDILRVMVALNEDLRPSTNALLSEIKRIDNFLETPKSFKQKDELFGLGRSKINTGISLPVSHDFHFSGQNPLPKPVKQMFLGGEEIEEERISINPNLSSNKKETDRKISDRQEIFYLSSEILPPSEFYQSIESNIQPPTFVNYRVSIQSQISRPSNERPSESIKKCGFTAEVNTMSPIGSPFRISTISQKPFEETQYIDYQTPDKMLYLQRNTESNGQYVKINSESNRKVHMVEPGSLGRNVIKISYSPEKSEKSARRLREVEEEFQRKSIQIQEKKKAVDRSLNILRDACDFLKGSRLNLV